MALSSSSNNSWILSLKTMLITAGVISIAVTTKLATPLIVNFAVNDLPAVWSVIISWVKPPFLYVIINGIIIIIVASTRFQHNNHENQDESQNLAEVNINAPNPPPVNFGVPDIEIERIVMVEPPAVFETKRVADIIDVDETEVVDRFEDELVTSTSTWHPSNAVINSTQFPNKIEPEFNFPVREKQLVSSRFVHNRKPLTKTSPEGGRALRVLKPKKHETLESTWKMITDGRNMPLNRHLNKSDTFRNVKNDRESNEFTSAVKVVKKSETFKDRTNYENENQYLQTNLSPMGSIGKLKNDGSDELNRRVEAFIKKFNDDMRLQRQESLNQYMEMVNRGVH